MTETASRRSVRRWAGWLVGATVVVGSIVLVVAFNSRFGTDPSLVDTPLIGQPVPAVSLPYLEKEGSLAFDDTRGEILVINFWASWCFPCRQEHAALVGAANAYRDQGVRFVGVVYQDRPGNAIAFLDELGRGYDSVVDARSRAAIEFGVFGIPETFFVDRDGTVVGKFSGPTDAAGLTQTIEAILAGESIESRRTGPVQEAPGG